MLIPTRKFDSISLRSPTVWLRWLSLLLLVAVNSGATVAQEDNRFQIDMIIFANNDANAVMAEDWPRNLYLRYPRNWAKLHWGDKGESFERVAAADEEFAKAAASIKRSSYYRVLYEASWEQDLVDRKRAPAVLVKGGNEHGEHKELEGYVRVAVERYLYVETQLWLTRFGQESLYRFSGEEPQNRGRYFLPRQPVNIDEAPTLADDEYESSPEYRAFLAQNPQLTEQDEQTATAASRHNPAIQRIVKMEQTRRMRSGELHFFDHPLFGAVVKITKAAKPVTPPIGE